RLVLCVGEGDADRVGPIARIGPLMRCDDPVMPDDIDEVNGDQSSIRALLPVAANAADMVGIAERRKGEAALLCGGNRLLGCFAGDDLPEAGVAIEDENRAVALHKLHMLVET